MTLYFQTDLYIPIFIGTNMTIYAVVNTKGGVGKTTTAVHLATMLSKDEKTLLIDGDPQASAASWAAWRHERTPAVKYGPSTICLYGEAIYHDGKTVAAGFQNTVVDAGGRDSVGLRAALAVANYALIPVGASNFDAAAMTDLIEIIEKAKFVNAALKVKVLLTRIDPRTKDAGEMLEYLSRQNLSILNTRVCERVAYRRATGEGRTVIEAGKDINAAAEMDSLYAEVKQ